jgi:hypothetical protein
MYLYLHVHCFFNSADIAPLIPETKVNWNSNTGISEEDHPVPQLAKTEYDDDNASMEELVVAAAPEKKALVPAKKSSTVVRFAGYSLRTLLLDVPLFIILVTFFACLWLHHVHDAYLEPQLQALLWTDERAAEEITYYLRECDATDMTTHDGAELFLPPDVTPEEAYEHQLLHGFSVFPGVLAPTTADNLRNYVMSKNRNLTEDESIFVIAGENRFSFGLGTEEPSVTAAMMELANSERLRPTLEKVLGPNPSLIEMTAITSSYGAEAQYWHDDVIPTASAIKYARSFGPSYSVFIQLQNTTKEMGATSACPGSYYCSGGSMDTYCDEDGFQVVGEDGHWNTGDALLMNMNSYHRGSAHIDPNGIDRVMLILTFVPRPNKRAESRQMSQGITFSLRWDMWYVCSRAGTRMITVRLWRNRSTHPCSCSCSPGDTHWTISLTLIRPWLNLGRRYEHSDFTSYRATHGESIMLLERACEWPMTTTAFRLKNWTLFWRGEVSSGYHSFSKGKLRLKSRGMSFI